MIWVWYGKELTKMTHLSIYPWVWEDGIGVALMKRPDNLILGHLEFISVQN